MQLRGALIRKRRNRQDSQRGERCFAGPRSTFATRRALPSKPPSQGDGQTQRIGAALERLFFTRLFYICLDNPERSIQRVRERVAQGGHDVPDADVRRRYTRSLKNASHVLQLVHQGLVFDNSGAEPRPVFEMRGGRVLSLTDKIT